MLIDTHTHVFSKKVAKNRNHFFEDPSFKLLYSSEKSKIYTAEEINDYREREQIHSVWSMNFSWNDQQLCTEENESILKDTSAFKNIVPFAGIPSSPQADIKKTIRELSVSGFKGIGELAFYGNAGEDIFKYCHRIFEAAQEENLIVCYHLNEPVGHQYPGKCISDFQKIFTLISNFPALRIVFAHLGGGLLFYELMPEIKAAFRNVYYDTAAVPFLYDPIVYLRASEIAGKNKIIFGSDYPLLGIQRYEESIRSYLSLEDAELILGLNAAEIMSAKKPNM